MKKVISMLLSLVMIISVFSLTQLNAFASQSTTVKFEQSEARTVLNMIIHLEQVVTLGIGIVIMLPKHM